MGAEGESYMQGEDQYLIILLIKAQLFVIMSEDNIFYSMMVCLQG